MTEEYPPNTPVYGWPTLQGSEINDWRDIDDALLAVEATVAVIDAAAGAPGAVTSVNGETGAVVLDAADVGALSPAAADALFLTPAEGDAAYAALGHTHPSEESGPWRFQDTVGGTPGAGYLRTNTGVLATATQLIISRTTQDGYDIPPPGWGVVAGDTIYVQDRDDSTKWVRYRALEPLVRYPTYATGLVAVTGSAGATIANGQIVQVTFSLAGGGGGGAAGVVASDPVWDAKGDLVAGTGADAAARLAVGTNGTFLSADSAQAAGLGWVANPVTAHAALPNAHHTQAHDHTAADGSGTLTNDTHDGYSQYANLGADPATPGTNQIRLYSKDNGSGVATLYYISESGQIYELPTLTSGGNGSGAPSNASYVTLSAENKLSAETALGTGVVMRGTLAARPAASVAGRLYQASDTGVVSRDSGTTWQTWADTTTWVSFVVDGGGSAITTGQKGHFGVPAGTIVEARLLADQTGSIVVDLWKDTYTNYPPTVADSICASAKPTLASAAKSQDTTLTGWTTTVADGDVLAVQVDSASTLTRCSLMLKLRRT